MKTYLKILLVTAFFATSCSPSYMGTAVYEDDLYYNPNQAPLLVQKVEANSPAVQKSNSLAPATATQSSTKTNPNIESEALDDRNFDALQQKYTEILNDESIGSVDTVIYEGDSGYYLGGFSGSERDQEEAQRLRDMYPQGFGYYDNSGYNTAMWLAGDPDWNVYVDGNNVWWTPTWTNYRFYNGYNYSSMKYGNAFAYNYPYGNYGYNSYWGFNMGFGDSWYWDLNFGWGFSNHYYGSYYPYYGHYGYYGNHGYYGHHGYNNYASSTYDGKRRSNNYKAGTATNASASRRANTNATSASTRRSAVSSTKAGTVSTSRRSTTSVANDIRRSNAAARYSSGNGNSYGTRRTILNGTSGRRSTYGTTPATGTRTNSRSNYSNGNTNQNRNSYSNTRRSSSPSYNKPQTNTRPSYNRSSNSNKSNYSKSSTRSSYSKVNSNSSKPTYRSGSSKSNSGYSNSGTRRSSGSSGTSRSSVGSTRSRSSSSGTSTRSSSGSSRSSGGNSNSSNSGNTRRR